MQLRQIIIDELPYLFHGDYEYYIRCIYLIQQFLIENEKSIWILIVNIIKFILTLEREKKYIFIFDQYNNKMDIDDKIISIYQEFVENNSQRKVKIGFVTLSTMNNKDIKDYKINVIGKIFEKDFQKDINFIKTFEELDDIIDIDTLKFEDDSIDEIYDSLGRNIKNYNIINYNYMNQKKVDKLKEDLKSDIKKKIKLFYECNVDEKNIIKVLYFSTKAQYNLDQFLGLVKYIPFKYFIPKLLENKKKEKYIQVDFAFPLIEEIINELLESIIYLELNIYKTLRQNQEIDGGARGQMFEKFVTYHLNPCSYNPNRKKFFKDISISDKITIDKFIPRKNEKLRKKINKETLKKGTYLFTQKIINGKDLDILIVIIDGDNNAKIIEIQITIYKPSNKIFNKPYLQECSDSLIKNLNNYYTFNIQKSNIFFVYIFDRSFEKKNKKQFDDMLFTCEMFKIPFMLFDPEQIDFYTKKGEIINNLGENIICPYISDYKRVELENDDDIIEDFDFSKFFPSKKDYISYNNI